MIRYTFLFLVAWGCSKTFFESSIFATIILTCILELLSNQKSDADEKEYNGKILIRGVVGVVIGVFLLIVGVHIYPNNYIRMVGGAIISLSIITIIDSIILVCLRK